MMDKETVKLGAKWQLQNDDHTERKRFKIFLPSFYEKICEKCKRPIPKVNFLRISSLRLTKNASYLSGSWSRNSKCSLSEKYPN